jgi:hypothetical protein
MYLLPTLPFPFFKSSSRAEGLDNRASSGLGECAFFLSLFFFFFSWNVSLAYSLIKSDNYGCVILFQDGNKWDFPREQLELGRSLGAGAFGLVQFGEAQGIVSPGVVTAVAVKSLKVN